MIEIFPTWFWIFFTSMIPWWESRYAIPMSMLYFNWPWYQAMPIAIIGNILPIPFVLLFFRHAEKFLRNYKFWTKLMDWLFAKTRKRADAKIKRYEHIALLLFVAVPLPFTGAWTGSLIAYLFDLKFTKSIITIFIGIIIAALIMIALTLTVGNIFGIKI
jgi:uncharacterized membrane protein